MSRVIEACRVPHKLPLIVARLPAAVAALRASLAGWSKHPLPMPIFFESAVFKSVLNGSQAASGFNLRPSCVDNVFRGVHAPRNRCDNGLSGADSGLLKQLVNLA